MGILLFGSSPSRLDERDIERLEQAAGHHTVVVTDSRDELKELSAQAELAVSNVPKEFVIDSPSIRWFHTWHAGAEWTDDIPNERRATLDVTTSSGIHGATMSEHTLALIIMAMRGMHRDVRNQQERIWKDGPMSQYRELGGRTVVIAGAGAIGRHLGRTLNYLGMRCIGVRRSDTGSVPPGFERMVPVRELYDVLVEADVCVSILPSTAESRGLFDWSAFARMPSDGVFVNIGRGDAVVEADLVHHLERSPDFIACLDVTSPEPLPPESLLWTMPNVIITPHVSGRSDRYFERAFEQYLENLKRYVAGDELMNLVDYEAGY